ncbi:MAG: FecR family protein [Candidatus Cryptobacteroides sp.]
MSKEVLETGLCPEKEKIWSRVMYDIGHRSGVKDVMKVASCTLGIMVLFFLFLGGAKLYSKTVCAGDTVLTVSMPCKSTVDLQPGSSISYNPLFWPLRREVSLNGNADFNVTSGKLFKIDTPNGIARVYGTELSVEQSEDGMYVACLSGKVSVEAKEDPVMIEAGQTAQTAHSNVAPLEKIPQVLRFSNVPLECVISQVSALAGIEVEGLQQVEDVLYTGIVDLGNMAVSLTSALNVCGIDFSFDGKKLTIKGKK